MDEGTKPSVQEKLHPEVGVNPNRGHLHGTPSAVFIRRRLTEFLILTDYWIVKKHDRNQHIEYP